MSENHKESYFNTPKGLAIRKQLITPKVLCMHSEANAKALGETSYLFPRNLETQWKYNGPVVVKHTDYRKPCSPVPDFAKEYLNWNPPKKVKARPNSQKASKKEIAVSPAVQQKKNCRISHSQSKTLSYSLQDSTLNQIFRFFKPQIQNFTDKDKIRRFSTETLAVKKSKAKLLEYSQKFRKNPKKSKKNKAKNITEGPNNLKNPKEFDRFAETFGEKLWKLHELSVLNLLESS